MIEQTHIIAGESIKALWGHTIAVGDQLLRIGPSGHLSVSQAVADRLLSQSGWAKCEATEPQDEAAAPPASPVPAEEPDPSPRRGKRRKGKK